MRQPSLRWRVTAVASGVVAIVLLAAGLLIGAIVHRQLIEDVDDAARSAAASLTPLAKETSPQPFHLGGDEDSFAQLIGPHGELKGATENVMDDPPVLTDRVPGIRTVDHVLQDGSRFRVLTVAVGHDTLLVGMTLDDIDATMRTLRRTLLITAPLVLGSLAALVWMVVGRTLRPVEDAHRRQRQFVADASHELRSPLTRMRTELEVDLAHPQRADPLATHQKVLVEVGELQALVDDLLALASNDAGPAPALQPVDLDDLVLAEVQRLRAGAPVDLDIAAVSGAQVRGDAGQLRRVVRNLVENAIRHAEQRVAIEVREDGGVAVLAVSDDGAGIAPDDRALVFERFRRLDDARSGGAGGTGLGLAITKEIVVAHRGTITVDPHHHPGTRMEVRLPRP